MGPSPLFQARYSGGGGWGGMGGAQTHTHKQASACLGCNSKKNFPPMSSTCIYVRTHIITYVQYSNYFINNNRLSNVMFLYFCYVLYSTLLHLPPIRFNCVHKKKSILRILVTLAGNSKLYDRSKVYNTT